MKLKSMVILIAAAILFTSACSFQDNPKELPIGKYEMKDGKTPDWAWVMLEEENRFIFNRNIATSYLPMGTYSVEGDELVLKVNEQEIYTFRIEGDRLIFESGAYAESFIEKGTVFELTKDK